MKWIKENFMEITVGSGVALLFSIVICGAYLDYKRFQRKLLCPLRDNLPHQYGKWEITRRNFTDVQQRTCTNCGWIVVEEIR